MTKKLAFFLIIPVLLCCRKAEDVPQQGQGKKTPVLQKTPPLGAQGDLKFLLDTIEANHPAPFTHIPRKEFVSMLRNAQGLLASDKDIIRFWQVVAPLVASLKDAHTALLPPVALLRSMVRQRKVSFLPFSSLLWGGKLTVHSSLCPKLKPRDVILSINGVPTASLVARMMSTISYERREYGEVLLENAFAGLFYLITTEKGPFRITLSRGNSTHRVLAQGVENTMRGGRMLGGAMNPLGCTFHRKGRIARLQINTFSGKPEFLAFLDRSMAAIARRRSEIVILDLRWNTGGDSRLGDLLLSRFFTGNFVQNLKVDIKVSALTKQRYRSLPGLVATPAGEMYHAFSYLGPLKKMRLKKGIAQMYLLTGSHTFSSGVMFAAAFRNFTDGRILGEETGGLANHFGDMLRVVLPHSKLVLTVSHKRFVTMFGETGGVKPHELIIPALDDYFQDGDPLLERILSKILGSR
ncbi:hypothetical protein KKF84_02910 [Myxococcota bacterium]|nr:hypothetical protein [Myxococcota bacterium]